MGKRIKPGYGLVGSVASVADTSLEYLNCLDKYLAQAICQNKKRCFSGKR
jgi:hypothetical protein